MSIEEAKATIRKGIEACDKAGVAIREAGRLSSTAHALARSTAHDSRHEVVTRGLACLAQATHEIELVLRRLNTATDAADQYLRVLG
jgi:hypothetical protein